jgi:hypothetical protein
MRSVLFWDVAQQRLVVADILRQTIGSVFEGQAVQGMSVIYYQSMLHNTTEAWRSQLHLLLHHHQREHWKDGDTLFPHHVSSCDVNACSWDVGGDLTLNSMAQIHTCHSAYVTWSRMELWSTHVPARLSNFCCRTHFMRCDVRVKRSSYVTSCFQKWWKCVLKKCANGPFYMTPSHQIIKISIWESTHGKG